MDITNKIDTTTGPIELDMTDSDNDSDSDCDRMIDENDNCNDNQNNKNNENNEYEGLFDGKTQKDVMNELQKLTPLQREEYLQKLLTQINGNGNDNSRLANNRERLKAKIMAKRNIRSGKSALMDMKAKFEQKIEKIEKTDEQKEKNQKKNQKRRNRRKNKKVLQNDESVKF
jgi:hypothetical protein